MAQLTLLEAAKLMEPSRKTGIIELYASAYQPTTVAPVINTGGRSAYQWTVEDGLSHTSGGKRNVGSDFTATAGQKKPYESEVKIYGGKIQVDEYIRDHSPASVAFEEQMQIKSYARELVIDMFEGTGGTSLRGFRHWMLNDTAYTGQEVSAGATASGVAVSLDKMDELLEKVDRVGNEYLYMNEIQVRALKKLSRGSGTGDQRMEYMKDEFGKWAWSYDGIPIIVMRDGKGTDLLDSTEIDGAATNSDTMSIYMVSWGMESAAMFSSVGNAAPNGVITPRIEVQNDGSNFAYERLTWYTGLAPQKPRCVARLKHVKNGLPS